MITLVQADSLTPGTSQVRHRDGTVGVYRDVSVADGQLTVNVIVDDPVNWHCWWFALDCEVAT